MAKILISGGSGLVGSSLVKLLKQQQHEVFVLTQRKSLAKDQNWIYWDVQNEKIIPESIPEVDVVIHLAGENIGGKRWTKKQQQIIRDSRVKSCEFLFKLFSSIEKKPDVFISASAVGYYGSISSDKIFTELDSAAPDYLGSVCDDWECAADKFNSLGSRVVKIRTGVVFSDDGSALQQMIVPMHFGFNAILGRGNQYVPWIHLNDLCSIYAEAVIDPNIHGAFNAVSSEIVTYEKLMKEVCVVLNKKRLKIKIPKFFIKLVFGKMSVILIEGSRVANQKLRETNFQFEYPELNDALRNLLLKKNQ
jgi:uncharacterized protein (TIGR01777 family)